MKKMFIFLALLACAGASGNALAHGHFGVMVDVPLWPPYYPAPYYYPYYPPPVVVVPASPPVYIEQAPAPVQTAPQPTYYWYHCARPEGYYPYVKECPAGWTRVAPQPAGQ